MKLCVFSVFALAIVVAGCSAPIKGTAEATNETATLGLLDSMISVSDCLMTRDGDGLHLSGATSDRSLVRTSGTFRPPFVVRLRAKTDSTNLRIYYNSGMVIFNWERRQDQLRVHDPLTNQIHAVDDKGHIEPGEWHDIIWEVDSDRMSITVDGDNRFSAPGNYASIEAPIGVGPAFGSVVSIESFEVTSQ